jgi:DNA-binding response OmpR family regulator
MPSPTTPSGVDADAIPPIILLVEDDRDSLEMYSAFFEMSGMWVATSTAPVEAIDAVDELKPDVIVTDVRFGGEPLGLELIHALKARTETHQIPVIVLSGHGLDELPPGARADADVFLEKPVLPDVLLDNVRGLLSQSRLLRQRGDAARGEAQRLSTKSAHLVTRARAIHARLDTLGRQCPECSSPLEWIERGRIGGAEYDYYRWCLKGCGLFCYDRDGRKWVKLA